MQRAKQGRNHPSKSLSAAKPPSQFSSKLGFYSWPYQSQACLTSIHLASNLDIPYRCIIFARVRAIIAHMPLIQPGPTRSRDSAKSITTSCSCPGAVAGMLSTLALNHDLQKQATVPYLIRHECYPGRSPRLCTSTSPECTGVYRPRQYPTLATP